MKFLSEYFICQFYFLWPKITGEIFTPKTIRCSRLFFNFYRFYFWLRVFHVLHYQFFIIIFPKSLVIWLVLEFFFSFLILYFCLLIRLFQLLFLIFLLFLFLIFLLFLFLIFLLFLFLSFLLFRFLIFLLVLCLFLFPF